MSWEHAVAFVAMLQRQIDNYEQRVGSIPDVGKAAEAAEAARVGTDERADDRDDG
jgi:hypothetical protein